VADDGAHSSTERVLVLAPFGRNALLLCKVLDRAGLTSLACRSMADLLHSLEDGAATLLLTEEALGPAAVSSLVRALSGQPPWSDLPVILLAAGGPLSPERARTVAALQAVGNLTVLERPVRSLPLVTSVQAALRGRRRQYEIRNLVERERDARQAAKTASQAKDVFLATISHELRTPLTSILISTGLLHRNRLSASDTQRTIGVIERSAKAQSRLIEELLDVARMVSGKLQLHLEDADLATIVDAAVDVVRPAAENRQIALDVAVEPCAFPVRVDLGRIQQVLWNLLSNAIKFTPPGGRVKMRVQRDAEGHAHIEVADTGKGISPEFLPHVFERFQQAAVGHESQCGLGLGLSICLQLTELHGGTIRAASPGEGRGTVFTVTLPLARKAA
jgi:signal transduction histidine kinase